jgi:MFS family permease
MSASVMAAALPNIAQDLETGSSVIQIIFSVYFLGLAVGPIPIAAFSESYGRRPVWICCNLWYSVWNSLCPVGNSSGLMTAGRFLAGTGASVGIAVRYPNVSFGSHRKESGSSHYFSFPDP